MGRKLSLQQRAKIKYINEIARERLMQILQAINLELKSQALVNRKSIPNAGVNSEEQVCIWNEYVR